MSSRKNHNNSEGTLSQWHLAHYKFHIDCCGNEPGPRRYKWAINCLSCDKIPCNFSCLILFFTGEVVYKMCSTVKWKTIKKCSIALLLKTRSFVDNIFTMRPTKWRTVGPKTVPTHVLPNSSLTTHSYITHFILCIADEELWNERRIIS